MNFKQYLAESTFDIDKFKKDCAYFFDHLEHGKFFYHGDKNAPKDWTIKQFKPRTGPRDSPSMLHEKANEFFEEKFGWPFRNGLFVTGKYNDAKQFGPTTVIFPIGKFEWLSNPDFTDLTGTYETRMTKLRHLSIERGKEDDYDERSQLAANQIIEEMKKSTKWYHNRDLWMCGDMGAEVMFKCDSYYQFDAYGETFSKIMTEIFAR